MNKALIVSTAIFLIGIGIPAGLALNNPLATLNDTEITVPATATELKAVSSSIKSFDSVYIGNSLVTCIRVGGPTLTTTSGYDVGSGCRDGVGVSIDATQIFVMDDGGGTVAGVDVLWGKR